MHIKVHTDEELDNVTDVWRTLEVQLRIHIAENQLDINNKASIFHIWNF